MVIQRRIINRQQPQPQKPTMFPRHEPSTTKKIALVQPGSWG